MGAASRTEALTADRTERKFTIPREHARRFAATLDSRLGRHRFTGEGANRLPGAHHFTTTIYFDTPDRSIYRAAHGTDIHTKIRAREYYDVHPSLTQVATDPRGLVRYKPELWLETKERRGSTTAKKRIAMKKADVPGHVAEMGLAASCLVNYRRLAWQSGADDLRITLDVGLAFFRPPADLWTRTEALVREALGAPAGEEMRAVVEVKSLGEVAEYFNALVYVLGGEEISYSKFEHASQAVHG